MQKYTRFFAFLWILALALTARSHAYFRNESKSLQPVRQGQFAGPSFRARDGRILRSNVYNVRSWFDDVRLLLTEVEGNTDGEAVVYYPGTIMTPQAYAELAAAAHELGFRVYFAQARRTGHLKWRSGRGLNNGLQEKLYHDAPALMEGVALLNPGKPVHLFGHSLGGMMTIANGANRNLAERVGGQFGRIQSFAGPHSMSFLPLWLKSGATAIHPFVWAITKFPQYHAVAPVQTFFQHLDRHREGKFIQRKYAELLDQLASRLGSTFLAAVFLDAEHVTDVKLKEFLVDGMGLVSTQLLLDYGRAAKTKFFLGRPGTRYEGLNLVPVDLVNRETWIRHYALSKDYIADPRAFTEVLPWMRTTSRSDLWVLDNVKHVGPMVENKRGNFQDVLAGFFRKPETELERERFQIASFSLDAARNCEMALSPIPL